MDRATLTPIRPSGTEEGCEAPSPSDRASERTYRVTPGGWITPPPGRVNPLCTEHRGACAYLAHDRTRCPWCHSTWPTILATGWHSCEKSGAWSPAEREWRLSEAARMRREAAEDRDRGSSRPRWTNSPTRAPEALSPARMTPSELLDVAA